MSFDVKYNCKNLIEYYSINNAIILCCVVLVRGEQTRAPGSPGH
jgi:hypothetical protein